jgi:hypothetical protein
VLLLHILKWDHQPERRSRSWALSIREQRIVLRTVLDDNPGLKPRVAEALARAHEQARVAAARETGLDVEAFPETCPYSLEDIVKRKIAV